MKRLLAILSFFIVLIYYMNINLTNSTNSDFTNEYNSLNINSEHVYLYDLDNNIEIYSKNKDEKTPIASLTKIMTNIIAIENIENLQEEVIVKNSMFKSLYRTDAYVVGLKENDIVTYEDLLHASLVSSGADATNTLAITISGSEANFVELMNKKAKELGMNNTNFVDPVGLGNDNYSTAYEISKLLRYALENELFKKIFETRYYAFSNVDLEIKSHLIPVAEYFQMDLSYIEGNKTGYTSFAGRALASTAKNKNTNYMLITTEAHGDVTEYFNIKDAKIIYDFTFANYLPLALPR